MKYIILLADGMADEPVAELGGKTPLEAANTPNMDALFSKSTYGTVNPLVKGFPLGSDVGNMTIMGNNPNEYYTGRAPMEAANMGIDLGPKDVAFRCNLVTVRSGIMLDYSSGHITTDEAKQLIKMIDKKLGSPDVRFYPGKSYRHIMVMKGGESVKATPPHDITGKPVADYWPKGAKAEVLKQLMEDSVFLLDGHEVNRSRRDAGKNAANMIWLWGQGKKLELPHMKDKWGLTGAVISAVDLVNGIGVSMGLDIINVPGVTGYIDTNYRGKAEAALKALGKKDFVYVHVEATDEMGHNGDIKGKIEAVEKFDTEIVGRIVEGLKDRKEYKIMVTSDHATPVKVRTHTAGVVPYMIYNSLKEENTAPVKYGETAVKNGKHFDRGWELFEHFIKVA
ncbi:MAG: cofactor-independent phosphoglycerate mutase [Spirochaetia bacterium]|nr:cofactor-independent phosphoglycerate mutase [Spirochaetia bacterium]